MLSKDINRPDFAWLSNDSRLFLERGYLLPGVTPEERVKEIANHAESILNKDGVKVKDFAKRFHHYLARGYYSLASPIWSNFGLKRGLGISCFSSYIPDSIEGIMRTTAEVGMMSKLGGGTSGYFGHIRPRGSKITDNGRSDGSFNFAKLFDTVIDVISQGTSRKGQFAAYIDIEHPDIEEWFGIHQEGNPIQLMYYGVCVGDKWLAEMKAGDADKRRIWAKLLQRRSEAGIPYIFFKDNANNQKPDVYKDKDMTIYGSNLCVSGDTKILTKEYGHTPIGEHVGEYVTVWNGEEWSPNVQLVKTGENQKLYLVLVEDKGKIKKVKCTGYHKWFIKNDNEVVIKETQELEEGETLDKWSLPDGSVVENVSICGIVELPEKEDTFCCNEPLRHRVVFNGINTGNCSEISLPTSEDESFVCCLSSMNLFYYDEWKNTDAVEVLTYFLDSVMEEFITKSENIPYMDRAHRFAKRHRAIGIGALGWHSYLQSKFVAFDSFQAMQLNNEIFKFIHEHTNIASRDLAELYGEPELLKGYGRRHTCLQSVAPTKSSSMILGGVSLSVEPIRSNFYIKDLAKLKSTYKNPLLMQHLEELGMNKDSVWETILLNDGSVQHLDVLSKEEKEVFKTWQEISQLAIIQQAAQRQKYIDQGQSINVIIHPDTPTKDINQLYLTAHELGMKGLYYQFSSSAAQRFNRDLLTCSTCES